MPTGPYFSPEIETMDRSDLDALIDERVRYTVRYAADHSPFYRHWFREHRINPEEIRVHEDLLALPLISGKAIRENQPPATPEFRFLSTDWSNVFSIQETSGTSGTPKGFFLTRDDWNRYTEKYARSFISQGFSMNDRIVICASYGMSVGANTMTAAAHKIGMGVIPVGKCSFDSRILRNYRPTAIVGSVFKLLRLGRRLNAEGVRPSDIAVDKLVAGGESFAEESRRYLSEKWDCPVFNTYGSTEGSMCGECTRFHGLHVPEDIVHLDVYDPRLASYVPDGECGRAILTTLLPVGGKSGMLLLNYDTEDTTVILSRNTCDCGRTHMRIYNPQREAETAWIFDNAMNRVDVEAAVFQTENMDDLTGEYEAFIDDGDIPGEAILRISVECLDTDHYDRKGITDRVIDRFLNYKPGLAREYFEGNLKIAIMFAEPGGLEIFHQKGRPRRLIDRRKKA